MYRQISASVTSEVYVPETKQVYLKLMRSVFDALSIQYTDELLNKIITFQAELFKIASKSSPSTSALHSFNDLETGMGSISWRVLLLDFNSFPVLVPISEKKYQLSEQYMKQTNELMNRDPETTANYLGWKILQHLVPYTTPEMRQQSFDLDNVIYQVPRQRDLMEQCTLDAISFFRFAIGKLFYDMVAHKEERIGAELVMSYIRKAYQKRIQQSTWLDQQSKAAVIQKLKGILVDYYLPAKFSLHVTWDRRPPYSDIDLYYAKITEPEANDEKLLLVEWVLETSKFVFDQSLDELRNTEEPVSYSWDRIPTEFSAAYVTAWNLVVVPVSVLYTPWYHRSRPQAMNFGSLGFILAHEVAHAFDPTSFQYNYKGDKRPDDWSPACRQQHVDKRKCYVDQYRSFKFMGHDVDSERTMTENFADGEGLRMAYEAFKMYRANHPEDRNRQLPPPMQQHNEHQLFFLSFANVRCHLFAPTFTQLMMQYFVFISVHVLEISQS